MLMMMLMVVMMLMKMLMKMLMLMGGGWCVECIDRTVKIESSTVEIEERGVKLRLTVVDTPGYSDAVNCQDWYRLPPVTHSRGHASTTSRDSPPSHSLPHTEELLSY